MNRKITFEVSETMADTREHFLDDWGLAFARKGFSLEFLGEIGCVFERTIRPWWVRLIAGLASPFPLGSRTATLWT